MKSRLTPDSWILTRPIAHRGLWSDTLPENSMSAYKAAIDQNYPIEMDVQMSKDGVLYCFHDDNAKRMTGVDKDVREMTSDEIDRLDIGGGHKVPLFSEFLSLVNGRVPIMIEIKQQRYKGVEEKTLAAIKNYRGEIAIQSFDPTIMLKIKKLDSSIIRGQLGADMKKKGFKAWIVKRLALNPFVKPDFVHYDHENLPVKRGVTNNLPLICYTVRNEEDRKKVLKHAKNFVFEHITP